MPNPKPTKRPMSRAEHIREEVKLAGELGLAPKCPLPTAENFRAARSSPISASPGSSSTPMASVSVLNDRDVSVGVTTAALAASPWKMAPLGGFDAEAVRRALASNIDAISPDIVQQLLAKALASLQMLTALEGEKATAALYEKLSAKLLGKGFADLSGQPGGGRLAKE